MVQQNIPDPFSYANTRTRRQLRFALWNAWEQVCYWCGRPTSFSNIEIDHIIPKAGKKEDLQKVFETYGLPNDFEIHKPTNLAPICRSCNQSGRKGNQTYNAPVYLDVLRKAKALCPRVVETVRDLLSEAVVPKAFLTLASVDTTDHGIRKLFENYFPSTAAAAARVDPDLLNVRVDRTLIDDRDIVICLDLESRFFHEVWMLERFLKCDLGAAIREPFEAVAHELPLRIESAVQDQSEYEPVEFGTEGNATLRVRLVGISFPSVFDGDVTDVQLVLEWEGSVPWSAVRYADDGSELIDLQGEGLVIGEVTAHGAWSPEWGLQLSDGTSFLEDIEISLDFS